MVLRPATRDDLAVLQRWARQPHVIAAGAGDWDWEAELGHPPPGCEHWIAERESRAVGFVQILDPARDASRYWGDVPPGLRAIDLWVGEASDLGHGLGTTMMRAALARCFALVEVDAVLVDPLATNTRVRPFYERLGFEPLGRRMLGGDECLVYRLVRARYEQLLHAERGVPS